MPTFQQQYNWLVSVSTISLIITVDKIRQTMRERRNKRKSDIVA